MSVIWRCPCCNRRHFGRCPYAAVVVKLLEFGRDIIVAATEAQSRPPEPPKEGGIAHADPHA